MNLVGFLISIIIINAFLILYVFVINNFVFLYTFLYILKQHISISVSFTIDKLAENFYYESTLEEYTKRMELKTKLTLAANALFSWQLSFITKLAYLCIMLTSSSSVRFISSERAERR